jgi:IS4 transposase
MISDWVKDELSGICLGDKRLNSRVMNLLSAASKQPGCSLNKLFHTRAEIQACYRFFSNDLVDESKILAPHQEKTRERSSEQSVVLCLSDTTSLNYTTRKKLKDSGYISSNNAQGFFLHATIAITPERLHLGMIGQKFWSREKEKPKRDQKIHREHKSFNEKESYRWLEAYIESCELAGNCKKTQVVHVTDREGDIFEIFAEHESRSKIGASAHFLVRSNHNRTVYLEKNTNDLYNHLEESKILSEFCFDAINREDNTIRRVRQTVQAQKVIIKSRYGADKPNLTTTLNTVYLKEIDPPEGVTPINWCLLTSLPIDTIENIKKIVEYYLCRWEIETFFKTYKSGCKVEEKSLRSAERLFPLFSLLLIVAWRVNYLLHISRVMPEISCDVFFEDSEWKAGYVSATRDRNHPTHPPTMKKMMDYIAKLGGYLGRNKDPLPGPKVIWVGICKLTNYADAWDLFGPGANKKI